MFRSQSFRWRWLFIGILLGLTAWLISLLFGPTAPPPGAASGPAQALKPAPSQPRGPVVAVTTTPVLQSDFPVIFETNASVAALKTVDLRAQTTNTVQSVHVKEGDFVRRGQLLFTLDHRADQAYLEKARAQLAKDQASSADAQRQVERSRELLAQGFLSRSAVDTTLAQSEALNAAVLASQAALRAAEVNLTYNMIRSPMDGRIGVITAHAGSLVLANASAPPMLTITQMNPVTVNFSLPESLLASVQKRQTQGPVPVEVFAAGAKTSISGALSFIDSTVDMAVGGVRSKAQLNNSESLLWPGQSAMVQVFVDVLQNVAQIPLASIINSPEGTMVYVIDANNVAQARQVQILAQSKTIAAVSGLQGGEWVVLDGKQNLRPGHAVRDSSSKPKP